MDFFERWFGFSPDGGNGIAETVCIGVVLAIVIFVGRGQVHKWTGRRLDTPKRDAMGRFKSPD
jgi:hypothetical protein